MRKRQDAEKPSSFSALTRMERRISSRLTRCVRRLDIRKMDAMVRFFASSSLLCGLIAPPAHFRFSTSWPDTPVLEPLARDAGIEDRSKPEERQKGRA